MGYKYLTLLIFAFTSCTTIYYEAWEKLGKQKRDLLKDNIKNAQDDQQDVSKELKDALTHLKEAYGLKETKLERTYNKIKDNYDTAEKNDQNLKKRIEKVQEIAADLFSEWQKEIGQMHEESYRKDSQQKLEKTKDRYKIMYASLHKSEKSVHPILDQLHDQVLYLKHNLNAQALGSLKNEMGQIEQNIEKLLHDMKKSIEESNNFIKDFKE